MPVFAVRPSYRIPHNSVALTPDEVARYLERMNRKRPAPMKLDRLGFLQRELPEIARACPRGTDVYVVTANQYENTLIRYAGGSVIF